MGGLRRAEKRGLLSPTLGERPIRVGGIDRHFLLDKRPCCNFLDAGLLAPWLPGHCGHLHHMPC